MVDPPATRHPTPVQPRSTGAESARTSSKSPRPTLRDASPSNPSAPTGTRPSIPPRCTPSSWWKETIPRNSLPKRIRAPRTLSPSGIQRSPHSSAEASARPSEAPAQACASHQPRSTPPVASTRSLRSEIQGAVPPSSTTRRSTPTSASRIELSVEAMDGKRTCGQSGSMGGGRNAKTPPARTAFTTNEARNTPRHVACLLRRERADRGPRWALRRRRHRWPCGRLPSRRRCS